MDKTYNPSEYEDTLYQKWEESGFFNPDVCLEKGITKKDAETFCIIMPPPNANGRLHAGHALDMTLKDIITRYKRMHGYKTLFLPGADHAGFETQIVYERKLEAEGKTRFDMKPEELYQNILEFTLENKTHMESDVRKMGTSCDWSRQKFTLDPDVVSEVQNTFQKMFDDGLIYRGSRIINWCPKHQTSLSDVETEFKEQVDPFYYFKYGPFTIGTTRPETKFGDKHVTMHPNDKRYAQYTHGQTINLEWINGPITATVIKDTANDIEMGSGAMTITPWHSAVDFEIAERHSLDKEQIIDFSGKLLPIAQEFAHMPIEEAREKIVEKLRKKNLLTKIDENYTHSVRVCYKCGTPIEPQIKEQWFVKMKPLAKLAMEPVRDGRIQFMPKRFEKIFFHWMNNTIDWNISRQIIWGIPIPAKICTDCGEGFPDLKDALANCPKCKGSLKKDTDTFDTWFSSGQWPLLTLGYPNKKDFQEYYPTTLMETGADLVFKWVPRMIFFGMYLAKKEPFQTVYFHGMVNDENNKKMSKSKGNVISPITLSDKFGTDAMRMSLVIGNGPGNNVPLSYEKVGTYRNFTNKLWNIARYVLTNNQQPTTSDSDASPVVGHGSWVTLDSSHWILSEMATLIKSVTADLDSYRFSQAGEKLRDFTWNILADWYLEISKFEKNKEETDAILTMILGDLLKLWHPFMPFVTEAIWQEMCQDESLLMVASWPKAQAYQKILTANSSPISEDFSLIPQIVQAIRNLRAEHRIEPKNKVPAILVLTETSRDTPPFLEKNKHLLLSLRTNISQLNLQVAGKIPEDCISQAVTADISLFIPRASAIDFAKEKGRLLKEAQKLSSLITGTKKRLDNPAYQAKAPAHLIQQTEQLLNTYQKKRDEIQKMITLLS